MNCCSRKNSVKPTVWLSFKLSKLFVRKSLQVRKFCYSEEKDDFDDNKF